jgi:gamma-glutamylcyclotransferase (GGCT)/AIG2-like uncharacterized protein YtfP
MPAKTTLLFVYGSLQSGQAAAQELGLPGRVRSLGKASCSGTLIDLDGYPALITARAVGGRVKGEVLQLLDQNLLGELDAYEGEGYVREKIKVETDILGIIETWVYLSAKDVNSAE